MYKWQRLSRICQVILGLVASVTVLWLAYTHGTGQTLSTGQGAADMVTLQNYDGEGHPLNLSYRVGPQRVLITYPGATELLIQLGLADRIIGTLKPYEQEPPELAKVYDTLPTLEAPFVPTREEVLSAQPDLVMGWNHHFLPSALGDIRYWDQRGIETYIVPATVRKGAPTVENTVYPFIDDVGRIFGITDRTDAYKAQLEQRISAVMNQAGARGTHPTVLILQAYGNGTYTVYGEKYIIHDIVHKAGAEALGKQGMMAVGAERILGFDPDYIVLVMTNTGEDAATFTERGIATLTNDPKLQHMRAIQGKHIIPVSFSAVNNGNGRVVDVLEQIGQSLQD